MDREQAKKLVHDVLYKHDQYAKQMAAINALERVFDVDTAEAAPGVSKQGDAAFEDADAASERLITLLCGEARQEEKTPHQIIVDAARAMHFEAFGYAPRGMDKKYVLAVDCPTLGAVLALGQRIGHPDEILSYPGVDSLGQRFVVYWPKITFIPS